MNISDHNVPTFLNPKDARRRKAVRQPPPPISERERRNLPPKAKAFDACLRISNELVT